MDEPSNAQELSMLIAGETLGHLDDAERSRLAELESSSDDVEATRRSLKKVATLIGLAAELSRGDDDISRVEGSDVMPLTPDLADRIRRDAAIHLRSTLAAEPSGSRSSLKIRRFWTSPWMGWCVAASLALAWGGTWLAGRSDRSNAVAGVVLSPDGVKAWRQLHPEAIDLNWQVQDASLSVKDSTDDAGGIVWDSGSQTGYMRLRSLPVNNVAMQQYQLWIIDPLRDDEPVDGGVFDITQSGETIVPIRAKLNVINPAGFAVTIEKPGGVVVSDQSRLPLLAMVSK